jgi:hypothetical protein
LDVVIHPLDDLREGGPEPVPLAVEMAGHLLDIAGQLRPGCLEAGDLFS